MTAAKRRRRRPKAREKRDHNDLEQLPLHLFKYCGVSEERLGWLQRLIEGEEIYFPSPKQFNDPLDCRIPPSYNSSDLRIQQYWREYLQRNPLPPGVDRKARVRELIAQARSPEGRTRQTEQFFDSVNKNGVLSLSSDHKSMLMWSYYAEGHSGVVVRLKTDAQTLVRIPAEMFAIEVHYQTEFPVPVFYEDDHRTLLRTVFGTKSKDWDHEKEWRFVLVTRTGYLTLPTGTVDGVVLGMRTTSEVETSIRDWIGDRDIELRRIQNREGTFKLTSVAA